MKIEHHMDNGRCIHCHATDATVPTCLVGGKVVRIGDQPEPEPFKSFMSDLEFMRKRRAELFPEPPPVES